MKHWVQTTLITKMNLKLVPLDEASKSSTEFYLVDTQNYQQVPTNVKIHGMANMEQMKRFLLNSLSSKKINNY